MAREQPIELFMPPNMLKAKVGGGLGGLDMAAIKRAEGAMDALQTHFAEWAQDDVNKLAAARQAYAATPNDKTRDALLRAAHDMKGQAATFNYPLIARVAGSLSKLIGETSTALPLELVDAHVSTVHVIYRDKVMDDSNKMAMALTQELERQVGEILERNPKSAERFSEKLCDI